MIFQHTLNLKLLYLLLLTDFAYVFYSFLKGAPGSIFITWIRVWIPVIIFMFVFAHVFKFQIETSKRLRTLEEEVKNLNR